MSLSEKLILYFMALGFGAIIILSVFAFYSTKDALLARTFDQLISLRIVKKNQIEAFFNDRSREVILVAGSAETKRMVLMLSDEGSPRTRTSLKTAAGTMNGSLKSYFETFKALEKYFSRIFITSNKGLTGWVQFRDGIIANAGICDGTSILGVKNALSKTPPEQAKFLMSEEILLSGSRQPSIFIGAPVSCKGERGETLSGMLIVEIPVSMINAIMLNNNPQSGLGNSGETYLVGRDLRMRSQSRFLHQPILETVVNTEAARKAVAGGKGTIITRDYRGIPVLSAYSSILVPGLNWIILAEIDLKEAMIPIYRMRNTILILSTILAMIFFILVFIFAKKLTKPIIRLKDAAKKIGEGNYNTILPVTSNDEIGLLTQSFNLMTGQIKEKTNELRFERLGRLRSVIDAEESERQRLSREIHDGIGQSLIALKLRLEALLYTDEKALKANINILKDQFDGTVDEIRRISNNLMPSVLEVFGITIALRNLCDETEEHTGIKVQYQCTDDLEMLSSRTKTYIFRIAQEAINNIIKHSGANSVVLTLCRKEDFIIFTVKDDGKGFLVERDTQEKGNGLHNMRERVALMTGSIDIQSVINKGTTITIKVPVY